VPNPYLLDKTGARLEQLPTPAAELSMSVELRLRVAQVDVGAAGQCKLCVFLQHFTGAACRQKHTLRTVSVPGLLDLSDRRRQSFTLHARCPPPSVCASRPPHGDEGRALISPPEPKILIQISRVEPTLRPLAVVNPSKRQCYCGKRA